MKKINLQDLGTKDYKETLDYQKQLFDAIIDCKRKNRDNNFNLETSNYFLFVEHPHVYTLGKSGNFNNLLLTEKQLIEKGISYQKVDRGGDITYHGFGQIVGYPI
jgi:lipoyl(octanoyl) transferase